MGLSDWNKVSRYSLVHSLAGTISVPFGDSIRSSNIRLPRFITVPILEGEETPEVTGFGGLGLQGLRIPGFRKACSFDELAAELRCATGADRVHDWPSRGQSLCTPEPTAPPDPSVEPCDRAPMACRNNPDSLAEPLVRWVSIVVLSQADAAARDGIICPSPLWSGLLRFHWAWGLPQTWHRFWHFWSAVHANTPWDCAHKRAFGPLRKAQAEAPSHAGPPPALTDLLAATVTFRRISGVVSEGGMLRIKGWPSFAGQSLLRQLMPQVRFFWERTVAGAVFVAAHPQCPRAHWHTALYSLCGSGGLSTPVLPLRASFVHRTSSLDRG